VKQSAQPVSEGGPSAFLCATEKILKRNLRV